MFESDFPTGLLRPPLVMRRGRLAVVSYRSRWRTLLLTVAVVAALVTVGVFTGLVLAATLVGVLIVLAWTALTVRALRGVPLPQLGRGGPPPPPSGVREPRRPHPMSPAGAAALPIPVDDRPPM